MSLHSYPILSFCCFQIYSPQPNTILVSIFYSQNNSRDDTIQSCPNSPIAPSSNLGCIRFIKKMLSFSILYHENDKGDNHEF